MLQPGPVNSGWTTSTTGIFAKWGAGAFSTLTDSGNWVGSAIDLGGDFTQYKGPGGNTSGLQGISSATLPADQGMVVEYFPYKLTNGRVSQIEFGWSNTGDGTVGVSMRIYSDGSAEVWKNNYLVGSYSGGGNSPNYFDQMMAMGATLGGGAQPGQPIGYNRVMLIPCRDRELLVVSSGGASFCHVFQDLPEGTGGQTILDNATFWFFVPSPVGANLRFAYLQFQQSGTCFGAPSNWRLTPPSGSPTMQIYRDLTGAGSVSGSVVTPPTNPYSLAHPQQIELSLTGVSAGTLPAVSPFVYAARAYYSSGTASTPALGTGGLELLPYSTACRFEVSDTIGGTRVTLGLMQPLAIGTAISTALSGAGSPEAMEQQLLTECHRPLQIFDEVGMMLNGVAEPARWTDGFAFDDTVSGSPLTAANSYDRVQEIEIEVRDKWKLAEEFLFSDPAPLDGLTLSAAYLLVASTIGIPSGEVYVSATAASFTIPEGAPSGGEFAFLCDVGDKGSEILDRLHQTYASTWFHGFRPQPSGPPRLCLIDPADATSSGLPSSASLTLYESVEAASAGGISAGSEWKSLYRSFKQTVLEPEANDLCVVGRDPRGGKPIVAHKADAGSQDPTVGIALRPSNWLGSVKKYSWIDPGITTIGSAQYALDFLFTRLTAPRMLVEWECEYLPGLWRGDLVSLHRPFGEAAVTVRIKTFSGVVDAVSSFGGDSSVDTVWRPCRYVGEVAVSEGAPPIHPLDVLGTSLSGIAAQWHSLKALAKSQWMAGDRLSAQVMAGRPVLNQQEF